MIDQPAVPVDSEGTDRIVKEIRKLRWIGQEQEALALERSLHRSPHAIAQSGDVRTGRSP